MGTSFSFGNNAIPNLTNPSREAMLREIDELSVRVVDLVGKMNELFMRPRMPYTQSASSGDILKIGVYGGLKPEWGSVVIPSLTIPTDTQQTLLPTLPPSDILDYFVTPSVSYVEGGGTANFTATVVYIDLTSKDVTDESSWSAFPGTYASVSNGVATAGSPVKDESESISATYKSRGDSGLLYISGSSEPPVSTPASEPSSAPPSVPSSTPTSTY